MPKNSQLICQQLQKVAVVVLEEYQGIIRHYIRGRNGVYALYVAQVRRHRLRARHKGKYIRARVRADDSITARGSRGRKFNSPSMGARHAVGRNTNGWGFWQCERSPGEWVRLTRLRD